MRYDLMNVEDMLDRCEPPPSDAANAQQPPCLQCGAMTPDEATTKCLGQAAGDGCHGCDIWPE